jgi:hypothetical protein
MKYACKMLQGVGEGKGKSYDALYGMPHGDGEVSQELRVAKYRPDFFSFDFCDRGRARTGLMWALSKNGNAWGMFHI